MQDLTTGSLTGHLLKTTSYMLVSMLFQTLYVLVDLYWVGRFGTEAVAAVAVSGNLTFIVLAATQILASAPPRLSRTRRERRIGPGNRRVQPGSGAVHRRRRPLPRRSRWPCATSMPRASVPTRRPGR